MIENPANKFKGFACFGKISVIYNKTTGSFMWVPLLSTCFFKLLGKT